ncbi:hypothetical protein HaLaN_11621 [Haematococcus lacustris]|uniref:Uncharacterized protein n=1 Tax=Haematococcus lacustris TaxID=44745 RepID=A0A699Z8F9_HAELA|nr:hypothetical protein HaLaN_11621 [Haematococcus lacustris]
MHPGHTIAKWYKMHCKGALHVSTRITAARHTKCCPVLWARHPTPCSRPDEEVISRRHEQAAAAVAGPAGPASGTFECSPEPAGCKQ